MAGDVIKDLATPAHQPGQALAWLLVRLLQSWRDALLLGDLGGTGVQMNSWSRQAWSLSMQREHARLHLLPLCSSKPRLSQGIFWTLVELCVVGVFLQRGPH